MIPQTRLMPSIGVFAVVLLQACAPDTIHRADLESWQSCDLRESGLIVDIPKDAFLFSDIVMIHHRSNGPLADATWYITLSVDNKTRAFFADPPAPGESDLAPKDPKYAAWLSFMRAYHHDVDAFVRDDDASRHYRHYRRDIDLPDGSIASIKVDYTGMRFSPAERMADDAAIRRILRSAKPNGKPAAEWKR